MESPEYIRTSLAAAIALGFENGSFKDGIKLTGLNFLLTYREGCQGNCAYCGVSKFNKGPGAKKTFIRVKWPVYRLDQVLGKVAAKEKDFQRICLSMVTHKNAFKDTIEITRKIKQVINLPISILISPTLIEKPPDLQKLKNSGAQMVGIAIDAATSEIFKRFRGEAAGGPHDWNKYWEVLDWSVAVFGEFRAGIHLMVGLGETEEEAVLTIYRAQKMGAKTHLFSFFPEPGSLLVNKLPPNIYSYRRVQIARYLLNERNFQLQDFSFDSKGKITGIKYDLGQLAMEGFAFMTSGCSGEGCDVSACNRPFANERPSEAFRNYPYFPGPGDRDQLKKQMEVIYGR